MSWLQQSKILKETVRWGNRRAEERELRRRGTAAADGDGIGGREEFEDGDRKGIEKRGCVRRGGSGWVRCCVRRVRTEEATERQRRWSGWRERGSWWRAEEAGGRRPQETGGRHRWMGVACGGDGSRRGNGGGRRRGDGGNVEVGPICEEVPPSQSGGGGGHEATEPNPFSFY